MREILFKAKRINNEEWVEGYVTRPFARDKENNITEYCFNALDEMGFVSECIVLTETICQYTGLTDKNGNKIWENDLIEVKKGKSHFISQIEWDDWCKGFMFQDTKTTACGMDALSGSGCYHFDYEVIGNVFDNPELVRGR